MNQKEQERAYLRWKGYVIGVVINAYGYQPDIEDLYADAYINMVRTKPVFDNELKMRNWLIQTTKRLLIDRLRKNKRNRAYPEIFDWKRSKELSPEDSMIEQEELESVRKAVETIPEPIKSTFKDVYLKGMKNKDYAEAHGVPLGTVIARTRYAKKYIKQYYGISK